MCGRMENKRTHGYMDFNLFQNIVVDAVSNNIKVFQLSFYGEPLLHPKLVDAVKWIKEKEPKATIIINTNAQLLTRNYAKELLDAGISLISISLEGNNKCEYEKIRVGLKWDIIRKNIKATRELIKEGNYKTKVYIRGLHLKDYPIDVNQYKKTWSEYADSVMVRNDHYLCSKEKENVLHRIIPCNKIMNQMIIMVDGRVTICAYDWEGEMTYGEYPTNNIAELWKTSSLANKRTRHLLGFKKSIPFCNKCTYRAF